MALHRRKATGGLPFAQHATDRGGRTLRPRGDVARGRALSAALAVPLCIVLALGLSGCAHKLAADDLMANVERNDYAGGDPVDPPDTVGGAVLPNGPDRSSLGPLDAPSGPVRQDDAEADAVAGFSVRLFQQCSPGNESMLVSPLSALCALGMAANGADGETLRQMEETFGLPLPQLNAYLQGFSPASSEGSGGALKLADSLWIRDAEGFDVDPAFLQANADFYGAGVFRAPFDRTTVGDINAWTSEHTDGMVPSIVDDIPDGALLYLVNALAFEAAWLNEYEDGDVHDATFTCEDGSKQPARLMHSTERSYLQDNEAVGFVKTYEGGRYAFAALLPDEGTSVADYAASLTGERLRDVLEGARHDVVVDAALPKFEGDWSSDLGGALAQLGMEDAFDPDSADFSGIAGAPGDLFIGAVAHRTHVEVDEHGTKAAAATALIMDATAAMPEQEPEVKVVHLDRPFVYAIVDFQTKVPLFLGTVMAV